MSLFDPLSPIPDSAEVRGRWAPAGRWCRHDGVVTFKLNAVVGGSCWMLLVDTNQPELEDAVPLAFGSDYDVPGRSLLLLEARRVAANPPSRSRPAFTASLLSAIT